MFWGLLFLLYFLVVNESLQSVRVRGDEKGGG